ncbi:MAG: Arm DNA-binding domain-containing protein [Roseovarius sp.]|nr:Arm DNA-binding domain-containing protein [Roseovarius sp.]
MGHLSGKLTKRQIDTLPTGRHGDGNGLFLVVKPSGARSWIVRLTVKGQKNTKGAPLRTDLGIGGVGYVPLHEARETRH